MAVGALSHNGMFIPQNTELEWDTDGRTLQRLACAFTFSFGIDRSTSCIGYPGLDLEQYTRLSVCNISHHQLANLLSVHQHVFFVHLLYNCLVL